MPDKILTCRDCGSNFTFTTSEQDFFASKGFTNPAGAPVAVVPARQPQGIPVSAVVTAAATSRCTPLFVDSAVRTPRCLSSHEEISPSTVRHATKAKGAGPTADAVAVGTNW
jgi:hypothetical protein